MSKVNEIQKYFTRFSVLDRVTSCQYLSFCSIGAAEKYKRNALKTNWILEWNSDTIIVITLLVNSESKIKKELFTKDYFSYINRCLYMLDHLSFPKKWLDNIESLGGHAVFAPFFMQQKSYQEYIYSKLYRYYRIFNYDDKTRKFFANKTGVPDYLEFGYFASMPGVIKSSLNGLNDVDSFYRYQRLIELLLNKNTNVVNYLTISYKDFIKQTTDKCNTNNLEEVDFSYKVLHEKPIISIEGKNYLVCSHAFEYTCTDGLFSTVTFQEKIKDYLGKFALEDYLNDIAEESSLYLMVDKSKRRDRFKYKKNYNDPADLIFKKTRSLYLSSLKNVFT